MDWKHKSRIGEGEPEVDKSLWREPKTTLASAASGLNASSSKTLERSQRILLSNGPTVNGIKRT